MITMQDTLAHFAAGDRIIVTDGGEYSRRTGVVLAVKVLLESIVFRVKLDGFKMEVCTFSDWQLEPHFGQLSARHIA